ncbi:MAG: hypothetical protein JRJ51_07880 [Deltaproteobacteria bacterium]|nr:hypothetical protein [Deltaproteobacteria bacterium]
MGKGYNTIAVYPDKCNGCNDCIEACAQAKAGSTDPGHSRIRVAKDPDDEYYGVALCRAKIRRRGSCNGMSRSVSIASFAP